MAKNNKKYFDKSDSPFLRNESDRKELAQEHKEYLGMDVPDDYFSKSKNSILNSLPIEHQQKGNIFKLKPFIAYPIAASVLILISVFIWFNNNQSDNHSKMTNTKSIQTLESSTEDFLVSSLLIEDDQLETYLDSYIVDKILVEAELSEQHLENLLINSLFIEDSIIDSYINNNLVETLVL